MIQYLLAVLLWLVPPVRARGDHRRGRADRIARAEVTVVAAPRRRLDPLLLATVWGEIA